MYYSPELVLERSNNDAFVRSLCNQTVPECKLLMKLIVTRELYKTFGFVQYTMLSLDIDIHKLKISKFLR